MNVDIAVFLLKFQAVGIGVVKAIAVQDDFRPQGLRPLDLENRCGCRHTDDGLDAKALCGDTVELIKAPDVFRFARALKRLKPDAKRAMQAMPPLLRTTQGDFILDNLTNEVRAWADTGYRFVKRQSQEDPNVWLAIAPTDGDRIGAR